MIKVRYNVRLDQKETLNVDIGREYNKDLRKVKVWLSQEGIQEYRKLQNVRQKYQYHKDRRRSCSVIRDGGRAEVDAE